MKKILCGIFVSLTALFMLVSCEITKSDKEAIYGTWTHSETQEDISFDLSVTFNSDKTYTETVITIVTTDGVPNENTVNISGKYNYDGHTLRMADNTVGETLEYRASCSENEMIWKKDGIELTFTKN